MNKKQWFISANAVLIFLFLLSFSQQLLTAPVVNGPIAQAVDEYLGRIVPYGFSGAVLVAKDEQIILNKGYGMAVRAKNIPNTDTTVLSTGSITKQFTAAAIMKLEMQGKLNTSDPITKFFKEVPANKKNITLHHLLTHTSGIVDAVGNDYAVAKRDETITKILKEPLQFTPGEEFSYSNAGYSLLAAVIEIVSGQDYEKFLNEQLFKPAGMNFTGYRIPNWNDRVVAHWYVGEKDNGTPLEKPYPYWNLIGNGGILSTTGDLYRWHLALKGDKILSKEAKKKIFTPYLNDYGYGWDVLESDHGLLIQHDGGSGLGSSAEFRRYIDANVVTIIFCNQSYGGRALFNVIRDKLETLAFGGKVNIPPKTIESPINNLKSFIGNYRLSATAGFHIEGKNNLLYLEPRGQEAINALYSDSGTAQSIPGLHQLSVSIFKAALKGDFKPFTDILANKEKRARGVQQFIRERIKRFYKETGDITDVSAVYTVPGQHEGETIAMTTVRLKGEKESIYFDLYWKDGKNVGVAPRLRPEDLSIPILPLESSKNEFAGYHLPLAKTIRLSFKIGKDGRVEGLTLHNHLPGQEFFARKEVPFLQ
jgi:CubicO group peptidase (beta-lactamase class C family)